MRCCAYEYGRKCEYVTLCLAFWYFGIMQFPCNKIPDTGENTELQKAVFVHMLWNIFILVGKCMSCIFIVNWNFSITQKQQPYFRAYCMFHLKSLDKIYFEKCCVCKPSHVCLRPFLYSVLTLIKCSRVEFLFLITTGIEGEYTAGHQRERETV